MARLKILVEVVDDHGKVSETTSLQIEGELHLDVQREMEQLGATIGSEVEPPIEARAAGQEIIEYVFRVGAAAVVGRLVWNSLEQLWQRVFTRSIPNPNYPWLEIEPGPIHDPTLQGMSEAKVIRLAKMKTLREFSPEFDGLTPLSTTVSGDHATVVMRGEDGSTFIVVMRILPGGVEANVTRVYSSGA
jgi:hypothetical protein